MGTIYRRDAIWWVSWHRDGKRYFETSGSTKKGDAVTLLKLREGDSARGIPVTPRIGRLSFNEAVRDVERDYQTNGRKSIEKVRQAIRNHLIPRFDGWRMVAITTADVRAYCADRQAAGARNATINRELAVIKRAFSLAMQAGRLLARPHIAMLKEDNVRQGFFEPEQFGAVSSHLPEPVRPLATFAYITGWRRSEVVSLEWRQVDFRAGTVRLEPGSTKSGEGRQFPFTPELRALLTAQREAVRAHERALGRVIPYVWCWEDGRPIKDFRGTWEAACKAAGVPGRLLHDCRRTAVRSLERAGVARSVAMRLVGHKTESIYRRYAIVSPGDLEAAAGKLAALREREAR